MTNTKTTKTTKIDMFMMIADAINANVANDNEDKAMMLDFIDTQVGQLKDKAEKAKAHRAEKKAAGDALRDKIAMLITNELQTVKQIMEQIDFTNDKGEEVTKNQVVSRLSALVKAGVIEKEQVKEDSHKRMAYKLNENFEPEEVVED